MDAALADKAHKLALAGKSGPEIAKAIGVRYAAEAHSFANVGRQRAAIYSAVLTDPELVLIEALAAEHLDLLRRGEVRSPESKYVSWRAGKSSGWATSTAAKRLGSHRKGEIEGRFGTGLNLVTVSGNGYLWLTDTGWALAHAVRSGK
ncbi:hypothetical protein [Sphingomonas sp. MMS24-J13]|uniref:hypothetical protein n=1 Tax=Sphingomonas sp. MMS24-J13 TaxID=3238686 RepID=UPI00384FFAA6